MNKISEISLSPHIYIGRSRGSQFMVNADYHGIQFIDVVKGEVVAEQTFPLEFQDVGMANWLVTPDGRASYLFDGDEGDKVLEVEHTTSACRLIHVPNGFLPPTGLCWFTPDLNVQGYKGEHWLLSGDQLQLTPTPVPEQFKTALRPNGFREGLRVDRMSYNPNGLYVSNDSHTGFISLAPNGPELLAPNDDGSIFGAALVPDGLILCSEQKLSRWNKGKSEAFQSAPEGESYTFVDTLAIATRLFFLTLLSKEDGTGSRLVIYEY